MGFGDHALDLVQQFRFQRGRKRRLVIEMPAQLLQRPFQHDDLAIQGRYVLEHAGDDGNEHDDAVPAQLERPEVDLAAVF